MTAGLSNFAFAAALLDNRHQRAPGSATREIAMHRSRLGTIVLDCHTEDLEAAAAFWAAAFRSTAHAFDDPQNALYRKIETPADQPTMLVQKVDHASRVHIDIETDDIEAEVARLERLGARRVARIKRWWVMEAPTGHRFCVVRPQRPGLEPS